MLLLQAASEVSMSTLILSVLGAVVVTAAITYYIVKLNSNTILDCDGMYGGAGQIGLKPETAKQMISDYVTSAVNSDSCSAWFPLQSIQKFACKIDSYTKQFCNQNSTEFRDPSTLGIRIYFAKYPENLAQRSAEFTGVDALCSSKTTLVMVPTFQQTTPSGTLNIDFDPSQAATGGSTLFENIYDPNTPIPPAVLMMNHGTMIPPPMPVDVANGRLSTNYYNECGTFFLPSN